MNPLSRTNRWIRDGLVVLFFSVVVLLIYSNTFRGPFVFDDRNNIQNNPDIRLTHLTWDGIKRAGFGAVALNRPVANLSFALNYYFHQDNVSGYHGVNILIHIMAGVFLYLFLRVSLGIYPLPFPGETHRWIPFFAALLWLVHPIQTQSVTYIVQRMNSLAAMFYILAFLLYAKARLSEKAWTRRALFAGCILSSVLALGSKEISATLPFFIFLYEWYFFQDLRLTWLRRHWPLFAGICILFAVVSLIYLGRHPLDRILGDYPAREFTVTERVLTQFRVVVYYISLLLFPHPSRLNLDYDFALSRSLFDPVTTLMSACVIIGLLGVALATAKRERWISFCLLWFFGNLVIESSVVGLEMIFEHRVYLPSMLLILMAVTAASRYVKPEWLIRAVFCFVVMLCALWTYERNKVWGDAVFLWEDCVKKSPQKARPFNNLGYVLEKEDRIDEAIDRYVQALRINPDYETAHYNLGNALEKQGRLEEAISHYLEALRIKPDVPKTHNNLGYVLEKQGRVDKAIDHYLRALRIKPDYGQAHNNLGNALARQGRIDEAISQYLMALRIDPDYVGARNNLGLALYKQNRIDEAIGHYQAALRTNPDLEATHYNLANALVGQGRTDEAIDHYKEVLRINPNAVEVLYKIGVVLERQGRLNEAIELYKEALRKNPNLEVAHNNLGNILAKTGRIDEAVDHYFQALRIKPDYGLAHNNLGLALEKQGHINEAIDHYLQALRINPAFWKAHNNIGVALYRKGKIDEAIGHFREALRIKPDYVHAKKNLDRVLGQKQGE